MDLVLAVKKIALLAVLKPSSDAAYMYRRAMRYYSTNFSTALHVVETLPIEDVLQHYFEACFEEILDEKGGLDRLHEQAQLLSETEEERVFRLEEERLYEEEDDAYHQKLLLEEQQKELEKLQLHGSKPLIRSFDDGPSVPVPEKRKRVGDNVAPVTSEDLSNPWNPEKAPIFVIEDLPDISADYTTGWGEELDEPGVGPPPKKQGE